MRRCCLVILVFFQFLELCFSAELQKSQEEELNVFWAEISRSVREGDFESYQASCHPDGVLVSGIKNTSLPLSAALLRWKKEFTATKLGTLKAQVQFRFSQRLGDETTAHETGIFLYSSCGADGKYAEEYVHFEMLLVKKGGHWQTLMEFQKSKATQAEWDVLIPSS
jgi:hypothetical protein